MKTRYSQFLASLFTLAFICTLSVQAAPKDPPYEKISPAVPVAHADKLEVVEIFWYTCPHCYYFEDYLNTWKKTIPVDVAFIHMPAVFASGRGYEFAQIFYTAETLGVLEKVHKPLFESIHRDKKPPRTMDDFYGIFKQNTDVTKEAFDKALKSFAVDMKVRNAQRLTAKYGLTAVPSIVVQGKYRMTSDMTDGYDNMLKIVNELLADERQAKAPKK